MMVWELIESLKTAPPDDLIFVRISEMVNSEVSGVLLSSDVLIGDGTIEGITYLDSEPRGYR